MRIYYSQYGQKPRQRKKTDTIFGLSIQIKMKYKCGRIKSYLELSDFCNPPFDESCLFLILSEIMLMIGSNIALIFYKRTVNSNYLYKKLFNKFTNI